MSNLPITVLADDLTGACEIAAIGQKHGLKSVVSIGLCEYTGPAELVVYDTETRLDSPSFAAAKLTSTLDLLRGDRQPERLFKKTDSVLRGPVMAELSLLLNHLRYSRAILVPANPLLGRTIRDGFYRIHGKPLETSAFSRDLHHPVNSSWVVDLLGPSGFQAIHRSSHDLILPESGVIIGDAETPEDLDEWTRHLEADTLPAGSAAFFKAVLKSWNSATTSSHPSEMRFSPPSPIFLISGSNPAEQIRLVKCQSQLSDPWVPLEAEQLEKQFPATLNRVGSVLAEHDRAFVYMENANPPDPAKAFLVRSSLARLAAHTVNNRSIRHLIVEGGATAAAVADEMNWQTFEALHEWAPGVVSLRPESDVDLVFTLKPGSYPWPEELQEHVLSTRIEKR